MQARSVTKRWHRESSWLSRFFVAALMLAVAWLIAVAPLEIAALAVAGGILVTLVFHEPRWGLYVLPFAVPFGSIREITVGPATIGGTEGLLGLFLAAWAARGIARRDLQLERPPLWGAILLWYGVMLFSTLHSPSLSASAKELVKWGGMFALYTIAAQTLRRRDIAIVVATSLGAGTLAAVEGIYQSFLQLGPAGFLFPLGGRLWLRAYGRFLQPNPYAGYLALLLPLAYGLILAAVGLGGRQTAGDESRHEAMAAKGSLRRWLLTRAGLLAVVGVCTAVMGLALLLTLSRGAWIGATLAAIATGLLLGRRAAVASLLAGVALVVAWWRGAARMLPAALTGRATDFLSGVWERGLDVRNIPVTDTNFAVMERLAHWQAAYEMWVVRPWFGHGIGNYDVVYPDYRVPPWYEALGHAHNIFLNIMAETGLIGLVAYLLLWGGALWLAFRAVQRNEGLWRGVAIGTLAAMVHLHTHNLVDNLYVHGIYLQLALLLAMAARLSRRTDHGAMVYDTRQPPGKS